MPDFDWRSTSLANENARLSDLTAEQFDDLRRLTGEQRVAIAVEMSDDFKRREFARIRAKHPEWVRLEVIREWVRLSFLPDPMPAWLQDRFREDIDSKASLSH